MDDQDKLKAYAEQSILIFLDAYGITNDQGDRLDFKDHAYLIDIYKDLSPKQVILKAAQIGFSTLANIKALWLAKNKGLDIIYSLPSASDIKDFVGGKTNRLIDHNRIFQEWTADKDSIEQKRVGSNIIYFKGTWTERAAIATPADLYISDETDRSKQDIVTQFKTRLQHSKFGWEWYFSNPSVPGVGVDKYWQQSDQKHWFVSCDGGHEQYLTMDNIKTNEGKFYFGCVKCGMELNRRKGQWVKKWQDRDISGYWISLLMAPWVTAAQIMERKKQYDDQQFSNFVLGLPYVGRGSVLTKQMFLQNLRADINPQDSRPIIGVDTGIGINYVVGNDKGLFFYDKCDSYAPLEALMRRWPNAIMVIDQGGDIIGPRRLREQFPHRVYLCFFRQDRKNDQLIQWNDDDGTVVADRNKLLQLCIDEMTEKRLPIFGTESDWNDYMLEWLGMYRTVEENALGIPVHTWNKAPSGRTDYPFCFTADTLVATDRGDVPIKDVRVGDYALTRKGYRRVVWSGMTQENAEVYEFAHANGSVFATRDHRFYTGSGFDRVNEGDTIYLCKRNTSSLTVQSSHATQTLPRETTAFTLLGWLTANARRFTGISTAQESGVFRRDMSFITKTTTPSITNWTTWNLLVAPSISGITRRICGLTPIATSVSGWFRLPTVKTSSDGIAPKKADKPCLKEPRTSTEGTSSVKYVASQQRSKGRTQGSALPSVSESTSPDSGEPLILATKLSTIKPVGRAKVYDIEVEGEHEFFANGILVHNCQVYWRIGMDRYMQNSSTFHEATNVSFASAGLDVAADDTTRMKF